jgi:hypothetical protein
LLNDLFVAGPEIGAAVRLLLDDGPDPVVLARVGSHVTEDAQLGDVGIVFRIDSFEFRMERGVAGAGEAGIALVDPWCRDLPS